MWNTNKSDQKNITKSRRRQANFETFLHQIWLFSFPVHCDDYLF